MSTLFTLYGKCLLIGVMLQVFQQLCGINTVMYYGPSLLAKAGFGNSKAGADEREKLIYSLPLAGMNALGTLVAVFYIDKIGRRYIMLRMLPGIGVSLLLISLGLGLHNFNINPEAEGNPFF